MNKIMQIIKLTNLYISAIPDIISAWELDHKPASARRRFLRMVKPFATDLEQARVELQRQYATKDDKGNMKIDNRNMIVYTPENQKLLNKKWETLNAEEITIDVTPSNEADIITMKQVICDEQKRFIEEKKNSFTAGDFDYSATLEEIAVMITPVKAKTKTDDSAK